MGNIVLRLYFLECQIIPEVRLAAGEHVENGYGSFNRRKLWLLTEQEGRYYK